MDLLETDVKRKIQQIFNRVRTLNNKNVAIDLLVVIIAKIRLWFCFLTISYAKNKQIILIKTINHNTQNVN
jgi:hypothetical protein